MHTGPEATPRRWSQVRQYDWRSVSPPPLEADWSPTASVSVVMPAFECQSKLDLTLAALAHQRYPSEHLEVIVADDGSRTPLRLPEAAPANTRLLRLDRDTTWGRARACHAGACAAEGEMLLFLDADMVVYPDHVRAHARWHHVIAEAVTLGHKLFVDFDGLTVADVAKAAREDALLELAGDRPYQEHEYVEERIAALDDLTVYHPTMFTAAVGATVGMRTDLYRETGGFRVDMTAGEDMELGYRLMAAGAVFIPERKARSWHQGPATYMSRAAEVRRRNDPYFSDYVPVPGRFRPRTAGRVYSVPMIDVLVGPNDQTYEVAKSCLDSLLGSEESDLRIEICDQREVDDGHLLRVQYQGDPRVRFHNQLPDTGYPSRFTLSMPAWVAIAPGSLRALVDVVEQGRLGLVHVIIPGVPPDEGTVTLWRTAAWHRARRHSDHGESLAAVAGRLFGERWVDGAELGLADLRNADLAERVTQPATVASLTRQLDRKHERLSQSRETLRTLKKSLRKLHAQQQQLERDHVRLQKRYDRLRRRKVVRLAEALARLRPRRRPRDAAR